MYSIGFPNMFNNTTTNVIKDREATTSNLKLMLLSDKKSLFGDPYYGTNLKSILFSQNNIVLKDIVIDDIYTSILTFIPQLILKRSDIEVNSNKQQIQAKIKAVNLLDQTNDLYNINLTGEQEQ